MTKFDVPFWSLFRAKTKDTDINFVRENTGNVWICILILSRANNEAIMMGGGLFLDPFSEHRCIGRYTKAGVVT